jgi:hypothetical protein
MISSLRLLTVCFLLSFISCSPSTHTFGNSDKWLPKDFDPKKGVLLVEKISWPKKQQRKMEEFMAKSYPYKYEFITLDEIKNPGGKFQDLDKYKFVLINSTALLQRMDISKPAVTMVDFNFYDRTSKTNYPKTGKGSSLASMTFMPVINTVLEKTK